MKNKKRMTICMLVLYLNQKSKFRDSSEGGLYDKFGKRDLNHCVKLVLIVCRNIKELINQLNTYRINELLFLHKKRSVSSVIILFSFLFCLLFMFDE